MAGVLGKKDRKKHIFCKALQKCKKVMIFQDFFCFAY